MPSFTPQQLEEQYGLRFDTMVVDCEGCFAQFVASFPDFVQQISTIILEADYGLGMQHLGFVNYTALIETLQDAHGLFLTKRFNHPCCRQPPRFQIQMMVFGRNKGVDEAGPKAKHEAAGPSNGSCATPPVVPKPVR